MLPAVGPLTNRKGPLCNGVCLWTLPRSNISSQMEGLHMLPLVCMLDGAIIRREPSTGVANLSCRHSSKSNSHPILQSLLLPISMCPFLWLTSLVQIFVYRCIWSSAQFYHGEPSSDGKCKLPTECEPFLFPAAQWLPQMKVSMGLIVPVMSQILTACCLPPITCCPLPIAHCLSCIACCP